MSHSFMSHNDIKFTTASLSLPQNGLLIGDKNNRGKDVKNRLIVYTGEKSLAVDAAKAAFGYKGIVQNTSLISARAIAGPAIAHIAGEDVTWDKICKKSSEWTWLPKFFDIFKKTILVKVDNNFYDINAKSLEKAFGITKADIRRANRDITQLIKDKSQKLLDSHKIHEKAIKKNIEEALTKINRENFSKQILEGMNEVLREEIFEAYRVGLENGVLNYCKKIANINLVIKNYVANESSGDTEFPTQIFSTSLEDTEAEMRGRFIAIFEKKGAQGVEEECKDFVIRYKGRSQQN
jgi:hypothetical protein